MRRLGARLAALLAVAALCWGAQLVAAEPLAECLGQLKDMFPASGTPGSVLRQALTAAASVLAGNGDTAGLGASPFTAFVTVDGKFAGNGSTPDELALIKLFQTGLPRDKQAAWLLYNLLPAAVNAAELGRLKTARTHLSDVVGSSDYDLAFSLPPDFALGGKVTVTDRLGQTLRILNSFRVCEGWVHTVDGVLWPGTQPTPAAVPDPVPGGVAPAPAPGAPPAPFVPLAQAGDAALPPALQASPNALASTAFAATGAAINAAVSTIQSSLANGSMPQPPAFLPPGSRPGPSRPAGADVASADSSRASVVVGAVVGGAAGLLAVGAAVAAFALYRRRRRLAVRGGGGDAEAGSACGSDRSVSDGGRGAPPKGLLPLRGGGLQAVEGAPFKDSASSVPGDCPWPPGTPPSDAGPTPPGSARASAPGDGGCWEMRAEDVEICTDATGRPWSLGSGGFGAVYKGKLQGSTDVAVKLVSGHSPKEQARFANEVAILKALRHTNVVQFLGAALAEPDGPGDGGRIMLVTEYLPRGDLWRALSKDSQHVLGWYRRGRAVALDVVRGLAFMHSKKVMHLDLKSANILLGRDGTAKVADVGLAKILTRDNTHVSTEGTFDWAAPEVLSGQGVSEKADIYSLGVVLWEIITGDRPRLRQLRPLRTPDECPPEVAAVVAACRAVDPAARPTAKEVYDRLAAAPTAPPGGPARPGGPASGSERGSERGSSQGGGRASEPGWRASEAGGWGRPSEAGGWQRPSEAGGGRPSEAGGGRSSEVGSAGPCPPPLAVGEAPPPPDAAVPSPFEVASVLPPPVSPTRAGSGGGAGGGGALDGPCR